MIDFQNSSVFKLRKTDDSAAKDVQPLFVPGEEVISCYKSVRDHVVFTTKRVIAVNVQGVTGKKKDFTSIPYSKIQTFSIETSGVLDLDSELELYISGLGKVRFEFTACLSADRGHGNIAQIGQAIGTYIL